MPSLSVTLRQSIKSLAIHKDMPVAIACSGGPDSMALALLAQEIFPKITVLIVDHGLRKGSGAEAKQVGAWLKKHKIPYVILAWKGKKPRRNLQEEARKVRYRLMSDYCTRHNIAHLLVGHHLEDQAETFLLRLARGSGVDGLAAMSALTAMYSVTLVRPLLQVPKAQLLAYLKKRKQAFVSDPSNDNLAFDRVKMRRLLPQLTQMGITPERLAKTASNMARARAHLEEETGRFLKSSCKILPEGYALLAHVNVSEEIALRSLAALIMLVGGSEVRTRLSDLERLYAALKASSFKGATLGGCAFAQSKRGILIYRELRSVAGSVAIAVGKPLVWDNRFEIRLASSPARLCAGALTQAGWLKLAKMHKLKHACPNKNILYSLPTLRDFRGRIFAVPQLGFAVKGVRCEVRFRQA